MPLDMRWEILKVWTDEQVTLLDGETYGVSCFEEPPLYLSFYCVVSGKNTPVAGRKKKSCFIQD